MGNLLNPKFWRLPRPGVQLRLNGFGIGSNSLFGWPANDCNVTKSLTNLFGELKC